MDPSSPSLSLNPAEQLQRNFQIVNRALQVLSACTQAVIRASDEISLLQTLCHLITKETIYQMAWIGYIQPDEVQTIQPVAWAGDESDVLQTVHLTWMNAELEQEPMGADVRSRQPLVCQNLRQDSGYSPGCEVAQQRGFQSSLVLLLQSDGSVFGTLNIYSSEPEAFDTQELALLSELADSLSFGILALRTKQNRQRIEQALQASEEKFAKAFYMSPVAKSITTLDEGRYLDVNHGFEWLFGYAREEVLGRTSLELNLWQTSAARQQMIRTLRSQGNLKDYDVHLQDHVGKAILCRISAELIQVEETLCILATLENITERRQAELFILRLNEELEQRVEERTAELSQATTQLRLVNQELQRSNQELEQFAYVASHDLQEPLRAVTGYTQLLISEYGDRLDETAQSYAEFAMDGAKRMQQLILDLLAYSRVGTRCQEFVPADCNIVVQSALRNLQVAIAEHHARIIVAPLPTIHADQKQLVQLFQNLIGNAIKFCTADPPCIQIQASQRSTDFLFQVQDNGIGIKPQYLDRIFEVFKRLHTRREYPGTGIGLAICKKIVTRHQGQIWATSAPGVGTTFFFTIPLVLSTPQHQHTL